MNKQQFSEILLSRFCSLGLDARYALMETLILANEECRKEKKERIEDSAEFSEWAQNVKEILFSEEIGDVISLEEWKQE